MEPLERAVAEVREGNYGTAIRILDSLTGRDPTNADAWRLLARAHYGAGNIQKAADAAQRYTALRPADAQGHYNAGVLLWRVGQRDAARRALQAALAADPGHAKARRALFELTDDSSTPSDAAAPAKAVPQRRPMPWQGKVAAALTVVASLAILAWFFLPGGPAHRGLRRFAPKPSPAAVTTPSPVQPDAANATSEQLPQPTDQPKIEPQTAEVPAPSPAAERPPIHPMPQAKTPEQAAPAARQVWRQLWQRPVPQSPQQRQYAEPGLPVLPEVLQALEGGTQTQPNSTGPSAKGSDGIDDGPKSGAGPGSMPKTSGQPGRSVGQGPSAHTQPTTRAPVPLFSPADAQRVVNAMDEAERREIQAGLGYLANWLRHDPACNDPDFWPILQTALATTGPSMAPQGLTFGVAEVMMCITNARSAWEAADNLERYSYNLPSVLPQDVKAQIARVLAQSTSAEQAYVYVDLVLRRNNTSVSNYATQVLMEAVRRAEMQRARMEDEYRSRGQH